MSDKLTRSTSLLRLLNSKEVSLEDIQKLSGNEERKLINVLLGNNITNFSQNQVPINSVVFKDLNDEGVSKILQDKSFLGYNFIFDWFKSKKSIDRHMDSLKSCFEFTISTIEDNLSKFRNNRDLTKSIQSSWYKGKEITELEKVASNVVTNCANIDKFINLFCGFHNLSENVDYVCNILNSSKLIKKYSKALWETGRMSIYLDYALIDEKDYYSFVKLYSQLVQNSYSVSVYDMYKDSKHKEDFKHMLTNCENKQLTFDLLVLMVKMENIMSRYNPKVPVTLERLYHTWHKHTAVVTNTQVLDPCNQRFNVGQMKKSLTDFAKIVKTYTKDRAVIINTSTSLHLIDNYDYMKDLLSSIYNETGVAFIVVPTTSSDDTAIIPIEVYDEVNKGLSNFKALAFGINVDIKTSKSETYTPLVLKEVDDITPMVNLLGYSLVNGNMRLIRTDILESILDKCYAGDFEYTPVYRFNASVFDIKVNSSNTALELLNRYIRLYYLSRTKDKKSKYETKIRQILKNLSSNYNIAHLMDYNIQDLKTYTPYPSITLDKVTVYQDLVHLGGEKKEFDYTKLDALEKDLSVYDVRLWRIYIKGKLKGEKDFLSNLETAYNSSFVDSITKLFNEENGIIGKDVYTKEDYINRLMKEN